MPPRKSLPSEAVKTVSLDEGQSIVTINTPLKETSSTTPTDSTSLLPTSNSKGKEKHKDPDGINIEDLNLPKSIVTRLAKGVLPQNTQIQGNAILAMQKGSTVFINYLASHANEHAQSANRKTIAPADVFKALEDLEMGGFKERLEAELAKFNEIQADKRNTYRKRVAADKAMKPAESQNGGSAPLQSEVATDTKVDQSGTGRASKKARMDADADMTIDEDNLGDETVGDETMAEAGDEEEEGEEDDEGEDGDDAEEEDEEEEEEQGHDQEFDKEEERDEALDNGEDSD